MKTDFSTPRRQNFRGILVVFLMDLVKRIKQNIYVFLPLLSSKVRENYLEYVLIGLVLLILLQLLYSYKSYLNFKFHIHDQRFFLRQGVFSFTDTDIPFDRIQNININQNLIQQMLNVVGLEIETAGQKAAEIKIKALSREEALELKDILLKNEIETQVENQTENEFLETEITQKSTVLFHLGFVQLLKVGVSSNYIKGLGLVIFFISTLFQYIDDLFFSLFEFEFEDTYLSQVQGTFGYILGFIIFLLAATFIVTIGRTVVKYFNLEVTKVDKDFEVEYGLLKRVNQVIKKKKAQVFEIEENPIKNLFSIKNVFISQASSQELSNKKKIGVIGISDKNINILFNSLFDLSYPQQFFNYQSSRRLMFRLMMKYFVICLGIGLALFLWQGLSISLFISVILLVILTYVGNKTVQKSHIGVNNHLIEIQSGAVHTKKKYIATHKVQSITIKRNWFQQYNNHADLIIYTASGSERINYLKNDEVLEVVNYLIFKVESSDLDWI